MGRPRSDILSSAGARMRRHRERRRKGVIVIPPTPITEARRFELALALGLTPHASPKEISEALATQGLAVTRNKTAE